MVQGTSGWVGGCHGASCSPGPAAAAAPTPNTSFNDEVALNIVFSVMW